MPVNISHIRKNCELKTLFLKVPLVARKSHTRLPLFPYFLYIYNDVLIKFNYGNFVQ